LPKAPYFRDGTTTAEEIEYPFGKPLRKEIQFAKRAVRPIEVNHIRGFLDYDFAFHREILPFFYLECPSIYINGYCAAILAFSAKKIQTHLVCIREI
jgi:hypothetical protein